MSNNTHQNRNNNMTPYSFSGYAMADNISLTMDDGDNEVTRRIGGSPSFNASFNPSFTSTTIAPPSFSSSMDNSLFHSDHGASFNTTAKKGNGVQITNSHTSQQFRWVVNEAPTLPDFYPLEQTAVFVPNTHPSTVSSRISNALRNRSIEAHYYDDRASATCITACNVDFRVFLYRGKNQYSHGIIVEVQRRFGNSFNFYSDVKAILDAAEGKAPQALQRNDPLLEAEEDDFKPNPRSSLNMVSQMIRSGYDGKYLAIQTLTSLTDPSKVGLVTARSIAEELLLPENELGHMLIGMALGGNQDEDNHFRLQQTTLSILAHILSTVSGQIPDALQCQLLPVLRQKLRNAKSSPHQAHIAAMCLKHLVGPSITTDVIEELELAVEVGNTKHAGLQCQAEICLQKIEVH